MNNMFNVDDVLKDRGELTPGMENQNSNEFEYDDNDNTIVLENYEEVESLANAVSILENTSYEELEEIIATEAGIQELMEFGVANENTIVSLSREARESQLIKTYAFALARQKKDSDMRKLEIVWKQDKKLEKRILERYKTQATRMARENIRKNYKQRGKRFVKVNRGASSKLGPNNESGGSSVSKMKSNMRKAAK